MDNVIFTFLKIQKEIKKKFYKKSSFNEKHFVHRRRDLDSLGEFIQF